VTSGEDGQPDPPDGGHAELRSEASSITWRDSGPWWGRRRRRRPDRPGTRRQRCSGRASGS